MAQEQAASNALSTEQIIKLDGMVDDLPPEEREAAEGFMTTYVNDVLDRGSLSLEEFETLPPSMRNRIISASTSRKLQTSMRRMEDPGRAVSAMPIGLSRTMFNTALTSMDIVSAGLGPFTDPEGQVQAGIESKRNQLMAFKDSTMGGMEAIHVERYGAPKDATSAFVEGGGKMLGEIYPYLFMPAAMSTYTRTVLYNGLVGGVAGAATVDDAEGMMERIKPMTFGALTGLFASGVLNARQGFQRFAARKINAKLDTDYAKESALLEKQIQELTGQPDFSFSLGQVTANPFISGLEIGAAKEVQRTAQIQRLSILRDSLKMRANHLRDQGMGAADIVADLQETAKSVVTGMRKQANSNFGAAMDNVIEQWGDDSITSGKHYLDQLQEIMADFGDPLAGGSSGGIPKVLLEQEAILRRYVTPYRVRKIVKDIPKTPRRPEGGQSIRYEVVDARPADLPVGQMDAVKVFNNADDAYAWTRASNSADGGLNAEQTKNLLKGFRRISGGEVPVFEGAQAGTSRNLGQALRRAFLEELEMGAKNTDAVAAVKSLRKVYETDQLMIDGVKRTMLTDLLGANQQTGYDDLLAQFVDRRPNELAKVRSLLLEVEPALLDDLQVATLDRVVERSMNSRAKASLGEVDLNLLADALTGKTGAPGTVAKGLWTAAEASELSQVGRALKRLQETHLSLFPESAGQTLSEIAINTTSRSPEFVARLLTRLTVSGSSVSKFLNDPQARKAVIDAANSAVGSPKYQMASTLLAIWMAEMVGEEHKAAKAASQARVDEGMTNLPTTPRM